MLNSFNTDGVLAAYQQRVETVVKPAETDQPVPAIVRIEKSQVAPGLEVAEVAGPSRW